MAVSVRWNWSRKLGAGLEPEVACFVDMAYQNSERFAALINDVLDLEKIR